MTSLFYTLLLGKYLLSRNVLRQTNYSLRKELSSVRLLKMFDNDADDDADGNDDNNVYNK